MSDRYQVQNYLQVEQSEGTFIGMTCNTEYMQGNAYATDVEIKNYFGDESLAVANSGGNIKKDSIGKLAPSDM